MATNYGNTAGSLGRWQAYVNAWVLHETDTQATIRCQAYFHSIGWGFDTFGNGSASVDGQSVSSGQVVMYSPRAGSVDQLIATKDLTVQKGSSGRNVWCSATINLTGGYQNGQSSTGVNVWVGRRTYYQPRPPKNATLKRISDTQQKLSWTGDYTDYNGGYPWSSVLIDRRVDDGQWSTIAELGWNAINYSDNSTQPNHKYEYRLFSRGEGGQSAFVTLAPTYTTPAPPSRIDTVKLGERSVELRVFSAARYGQSFEVERSQDKGVSWSTFLAHIHDESTYCSIQDSAAPAGSVMYRVRSARSTPDALVSAWKTTDAIQTIAPPKAPLLSGLQSAFASDRPVVVRWVPNHPDGSAQSAAEIEIIGATTITKTIHGTNTFLHVDGLSNGVWKIRVRTKGLHADWGTWSSFAAFRVADTPQAWIASPATDGAVVDRAPFLVEVRAQDETGISSATLSLLDSAGVSLGTEDISSLEPISIGSYQVLANDSSYVLELSVRAGSGLTNTVRRSFNTHWLEPVPPLVRIDIDKELACHVSVNNNLSTYEVSGTTLICPTEAEDGSLGLLGTVSCEGDTLVFGDASESSSFDVMRVLPNGETVTLATGLLAAQAAIDRLPPLNTDFAYQVIGHADTGALSSKLKPAYVFAHGMALNFGQDASRCLVLDYNGEYATSSERTVETYHFADGGENGYLPQSYPLDEQSMSTNLSALLKRAEHVEFQRIMREEWQGWWRGHAGERVFGAMSFQESFKARDLWSASVSIEHNVFEEPNNG